VLLGKGRMAAMERSVAMEVRKSVLNREEGYLSLSQSQKGLIPWQLKRKKEKRGDLPSVDPREKKRGHYRFFIACLTGIF